MVDRSEYVVAHDRHDKWEVHLFPDLATAESDLWDWTYEEYMDNGGKFFNDVIDEIYEQQWLIEEYDPEQHGDVKEFTAGYNHTEESE